jgi:hypothetical protein
VSVVVDSVQVECWEAVGGDREVIHFPWFSLISYVKVKLSLCLIS